MWYHIWQKYPPKQWITIWMKFKRFDELVGFKSLTICYYSPRLRFSMWQHFSPLNCIKNSIKRWWFTEKRGWESILMVRLMAGEMGFKRLISHLKSICTLYNSISFNCIHFISCYWIWSTWMERFSNDFYSFHWNMYIFEPISKVP